MKPKSYFKLLAKAFVTLIWVSTLGLACQSNERQNSPQMDWDLSFTLENKTDPISVINELDPFGKLRDSCQKTSGQYLETFQICDCGIGKVFAWEGLSEMGCKSVEKTTLVNTFSNAEIPNSVRKQMKWAGAVSSGLQNTVVLNKDYFQDTLDSHHALGLIKSLISIANLSGGLLGRNISTYLNPLNYPDRSFDPDATPIPVSPKANPKTVDIVNQVNRIIKTKPEKNHYYSSTPWGCAGLCAIVNQWQDGSKLIIHNKTYLGGGLFQNIAFVQESDGKASLAIVLDPFNRVHFVVEIEASHTVYLADAEVADFRILKEDLTPWYVLPLSLETKVEKIAEAQSKMVEAKQLVHQEPQVVILENVDTTTISRHNQGLFLKGPNPQQTISGWSAFEKPNRFEPELSYDPNLGIPSHYAFPNGDKTGPEHGQLVTNTLLNMSKNHMKSIDFSIIPISISGFVNDIEKSLRELEIHSNARTINGSFYFEKVGNSCQSQPITNAIRNSSANWLWVFAAGNHSKNLDKIYDWYCPIQILGLSNLIKVSAGTQDSISKFSNYGRLSSDIVADGFVGTRQNPGVAGTSFAAPRVALVAANLQSEFQTLDPAAVRKAILYSADFNPAKPLPVSSGGFLNPERARKLAGIFVKHGTQSDLENVQLLYCGDRTLDCKDASDRVAYWKRTQIFSYPAK